MSNKNNYTIESFRDLLERSRSRGMFIYSDFHSAGTAAEVYDIAGEEEVSLWGGSGFCERVMVRFGNPDAIPWEESFPIRILRIEPKMKKYSDTLTHRDYLGALMNLGIERHVIGDIIISDNTAYVFAAEKMADYIADNITSVKHTAVICEAVDQIPEEAKPKIRDVEINVSSLRLDAIVSKVFNLSRGSAKKLFSAERVFRNGRLEAGAGSEPKNGDVISVRGHGKFIYNEPLRETKKGRLVVSVGRYSG